MKPKLNIPPLGKKTSESNPNKSKEGLKLDIVLGNDVLLFNFAHR